MQSKKVIRIRGAREHNLKNIDIDIPKDSLVVFSGLSGSGKSTLAMDTIFAEGQRRYLESLSSYARQFLGKMEKPDVDSIEGLSPTISIEQKSISHNPRSTVGTITEIHDYLRLLWAKIGVMHCPECKKEIQPTPLDTIVERILDAHQGTEISLFSPVVRQRKGEYSSLLQELAKRGYWKIEINGKMLEKKDWGEVKLARYKKHSLSVEIDTFVINDESISRIFESVERAIHLSKGLVEVRSQKGKTVQKTLFHQSLSCPDHEGELPEIEPRLFSFNSPFGACDQCEGLGMKRDIDEALVISDENKTIAQGAVLPWSYKRNNYYGAVLDAVCQYYHIADNRRVRDLSEREKRMLLFGDEEEYDRIEISHHSKSGRIAYSMVWKGIIRWMQERYQKTTSDTIRKDIEKYMSQKVCSVCRGSRYRSEALLVTVGGKNIAEVSTLDIQKTYDFFCALHLTKSEEIIAKRILAEVKSRLSFLINVGLDYLSLNRSGYTLSGGEAQRIRLASQVGSKLTGVLYILDEPSIGLHARDNAKLLETLEALRDIGNSVLVIEHDEETMRASDWIVDIGPFAGKRGGKVLYSGPPKGILSCENSLTGKYLSGKKKIHIPQERRSIKKKKSIVLKNASQHNLKGVTVEFPLGIFMCVTGVSGSGKSTLIEETLYRALSHHLHKRLEIPGKYQEILGMEHIDRVLMIDQSPIGRTPRSNPATYTGIFTAIRSLFASTRQAKSRGYSPGRFSFNIAGGRCDNCAGEGFLKIEMQFLPDVYLPCDVCKGKRYNRETLEVQYKGKNIAQVLEMTVSEACEFFEPFPILEQTLSLLEEVGLGYIELGQNATTLSGGEAQRIKLASELSAKRRGHTLYILDEPTTGLHFEDIRKLLEVLNRLVDQGNTVIVIEHNMDIIQSADYLIDLGPEGGDKGGRLVAVGTPEEIMKLEEKSATGKYLKRYIKRSFL